MSKYLVTHKAAISGDELTLHCQNTLGNNHSIRIESVKRIGLGEYKLCAANKLQGLPVSLETLDFGELEWGIYQVMSISAANRNHVSGNSITVLADYVNQALMGEVLEMFPEK